MLIVRILISLVIWFIVFSGGVLYTFNKTRTYQATGSLQILDCQPKHYVDLDELLDSGAGTDAVELGRSKAPAHSCSAEALQTQVLLLKGEAIAYRVDRRLVDDERHRFMAPYADAMALSGPIMPVEIIAANRSIALLNDSRVVQVRFEHPDPVVAARIASLIMDEYINYNLTSEIDAYMRAVEDLRIRLDRIDARIAQQSTTNEALKVKIVGPNEGESTDVFSADLETKKQALIAEITFRTKIYSAMREAQARINLANPHAVIVDQPFPPLYPHSPNIVRLLSVALVIASILSVGFFLLTACLRKSPPSVPSTQ